MDHRQCGERKRSNRDATRLIITSLSEIIIRMRDKEFRRTFFNTYFKVNMK